MSIIKQKLKELYIDYTTYNKADDIMYKKLHYYTSAKEFCLGCSLLSLAEIKQIEKEVNQENTKNYETI